MTLGINLKIAQNEDYAESFRWVGPTGPYALSDAKMQIRVGEDSTSTLIVEATIGNGRVTLSGSPEHWAIIVIPQAVLDAATWPADPAYYDLVLTRQVDGRKKRFTKGRVISDEGVTR